MQLMMMRQLCGGRHVRATAVRAARHRPSASAFAVADRFRPPPQRWLTSGACNDSSSSQPEVCDANPLRERQNVMQWLVLISVYAAYVLVQDTPEVPKNPLLQSIARDAAALQVCLSVCSIITMNDRRQPPIHDLYTVCLSASMTSSRATRRRSR